MSRALAAEGVVVRHGDRTVLDGVSLTLRPGELVLLGGRNGAGKSTLLRVLLGALSPAAGVVRLDGRALGEWDRRDRAREVAFVPQAADTPFEFTGRELVAMGRHPHRGRLEGESPRDRAAVDSALAAVDAGAFADRPVTTLSGGELRRIAVARALATEAPLLLLDEPLTNLDLEHALQGTALLRRLCEQGRGLLVASHDLGLLAPVADRAVLLHQGRVHADGPPRAVFGSDNLAQVFGVAAADADDGFPRAFRPLRG